LIQELLRAEPDLFRGLGAAARLALYVFALSAAGLALFDLGFGRRLIVAERARLRRVGTWMAVGGVAVALAWLTTQVGLASDGNALDAEIWSMMVTMPPGLSVGVAMIGFAVLGIAMGGAGPWVPAAQALGAVLLAVSFTLVGHTTLHPPRAVLAALLVVHLLGAAFWLGGLWPLARAARTQPPADTAALVEAWARTASWVVGSLVAAGLILAWVIVGSLGALFGTRYGWALLAKVALVTLLLGFAAWHRFHLTPALAMGAPGAGQRLARSIAAEAVVMGMVLWAVSELTATSPMGDG